MKNGELIKKHSFNFNPNDNSGEGLFLKTEYFANGDKGGFFINQSLTLNFYSNAAVFQLYSIGFTPENLRKLANELEAERIKVQQILAQD